MKNNFIWMLIGQGVFSAMLWINLMVLAHMGGAVDVGYYSFALSVVTPVALLCALSLRTVYLSEQNNLYSFADYFHIRKLSLPFAGLVITIWALLDGINPIQTIVILLLGAAKMAENMSDICYAIPHKEEQLKRVVISMLLRACIGTGSFTLCYFLTNNIIIACSAYALCWWLIFFLFDQKRMISPWKTTWASRHNYNKKLIKPLILLALPMGLASFINALATSAPRYFVEHFLGAEQLGYFSALTYFVIVGSMVVNSLAQTVRPRLAKLYGNKKVKEFWRISAIASIVSLAIGGSFYLFTILIGEELLRLFYGDDFAQYHTLFPLVALASIPVYVGGMWGYILSSIGEYRLMFFISILAAVAAIIASCVLIPVYGIKGGIAGLAALGILTLINIVPVIWKTAHVGQPANE